MERNTPRLSRRRLSAEKTVSIPAQPAQHLGVLVGGVVVEDDVDHLAGRHRALDRVEEPDELLMSMARHALADDRAVEHIEGGEQGGGAVALVIEGHRAGLALLDGQARLGAIECLDLALLVNGQHQAVCRGIDVQQIGRAHV